MDATDAMASGALWSMIGKTWALKGGMHVPPQDVSAPERAPTRRGTDDGVGEKSGACACTVTS